MKQYVILGLMRTGTTQLFRIVRSGSIDKNSILKEYFNCVLPGFAIEDTGSELINVNNPYLPELEEQQHRMRLLEKYKCEYTIKVVAEHLNKPLLDFLIENYNIICVDRTDTYDQLLSKIIALHTHKWNSTSHFVEDVEPFNADEKYVNTFWQWHRKWRDDKAYIKRNVKTIDFTYEGLFNSFKDIEARLDIKVGSFEPLYKMRSLEDKEKLILNITTIKQLYKAQRIL